MTGSPSVAVQSTAPVRTDLYQAEAAVGVDGLGGDE
jgi:hypothetical protein